VNRAVAQTVAAFGCLDVLVNNAGYAQRGALEEVADEQVQQMFDVNVFGLLRMIRAAAPHMRAQRSGRIINLSSLAGKLSTPVNGIYSATKFAVEALSDALRLELAPFGIQVIVVEPGSIKTHFDATAQAHAQAILANPGSPYRTLYKLSDDFAASMQHQAAESETVSRVIQQAIEASKPKARYHANIPFFGKLVLRLGDSVWDMVLKRMFRVDPVDLH
jgi:short-subunit dehydrogenase